MWVGKQCDQQIDTQSDRVIKVTDYEPTKPSNSSPILRPPLMILRRKSYAQWRFLFDRASWNMAPLEFRIPGYQRSHDLVMWP